MGGKSMTANVTAIIICSAVLAVVCIVLAVYIIRQQKKIKFLTRSIDKFIEKGEITDFSVCDNSLARLQNSVSELENMIKLERSNTIFRTKKNTEFISDISHQLKTPLARHTPLLRNAKQRIPLGIRKKRASAYRENGKSCAKAHKA